jgi:1-acyl-sn-glycerol-3-phosphate acyltransferase
MPALEFFYKYYFRCRAIGLENLPLRGPVLLVGNHSGGTMAADAAMTFYLWVRERGLEPPAYSLIEPAMFSIPGVNAHISRCGGLRAHPRMAVQALEDGGLVLVYPGGGDDAFRPYSKRYEIELGGNEAFIKLALRYGVPVVPVVTAGAHDTIIVLDDGKELAKSLGLDKQGIDRLPVSLSLLGVSVGIGFQIPFPAQISIAFGRPLRFEGMNAADSRNRAAVNQCFETVRQEMRTLQNGLLNSTP